MASQDNVASGKRLREALRNDKIRPKKLKTVGGLEFQETLLKDDDALDKAIVGMKEQPEFMSTLAREILPRMKNGEDEEKEEAWGILHDMQSFNSDKDVLWASLLEIDVLMNGSEAVMDHYKSCGFFKSAAAWSKDPEAIAPQLVCNTKVTQNQGKIPSYTAFSGASGSGKTNTMLWTLREIVEKNLPAAQKCLKYYISCNAPEEKTLVEYVKDHLTVNVNARLGPVFKLEDLDFADQCKATVLVLILDEVPNRWDHQSYHALPGQLEDMLKFQKVVLLVGSTAISQDVCRQPTANHEVLNIRMKPVQEDAMPELLKYHLGRAKPEIEQLDQLVGKLFREMPLLFDLMANHRCASLTSVVLAELLGKIPMKEIPDGWGQGNGAALLSMVACKYRALNGLGSRLPEDCRRIMLESLALLATQPVVKSDEGVDKDPKEDSLAALARELTEVGLVERAILPDEQLSDIEKVKVDGNYEFQMSPALTLVCLTTILPWIEGIYNAADHFEALVATLVVAMRYAQTNKVYNIRRLSQAVPYSGNEEHLYYEPNIAIEDKCFINGPQAPYSDLMLAGVPKGYELPEHVSKLARALSKQPGVDVFPAGPLLVQCKLTSNENPECIFRDEYAKMGFTSTEKGPGALSSPVENPFSVDQKQHKQYQSGHWLTNHWVTDNDHASVVVAFATNTRFQHNVDGKDNVTLMETDGDHEYAWQKLYPVNELVRNKTSTGSGDIGRKECPQPVDEK